MRYDQPWMKLALKLQMMPEDTEAQTRRALEGCVELIERIGAQQRKAGVLIALSEMQAAGSVSATAMRKLIEEHELTYADVLDLNDRAFNWKGLRSLFWHEIEDPKRYLPSSLDEYSDLMPVQEWIDACEAGGFTDYDGFGEFGFFNAAEEWCAHHALSIIPSRRAALPDVATHVNWFNK